MRLNDWKRVSSVRRQPRVVWLGALGSLEWAGGEIWVKEMIPGAEEEEVPQKVRQGKEGTELDWS